MVICAGGGGVPTIRTATEELQKSEAVIDIYEAAPLRLRLLPKADTTAAGIVEALKQIEVDRRVRGRSEKVGCRAGRHLRLRRQPMTSTVSAPAPISDDRPGLIRARPSAPRTLGGHRGAGRAGRHVPQPADQLRPPG